MLFKYKGITKKGESKSGTIEALSKNDAIFKLKNQNIYHEWIKEQKASIFSKIRLRKKERVPNAVLVTLSRDLSIYLDAGISIVNSIKLASSQYASDKKTSAFLLSLGTYLDEGKSFSSSLEAQEIFEIPQFFLQSIKVSEDGGVMSEVLMEMSRFLKEFENIRKQIQSNLFYPLFIVMVSFVMVGFMMTVVVPKITSIFEQMGQELPDITKFIISASDFLSNYWMIILAIVVFIVSSFSSLMKFNKSFKFVVDKFLLKLPLLGKTILISELARFSYMSSVLLKSGVPFVQTVSLAARVLENSVLANMFITASSKVVEGGKFSVALQTSKVKIEKSFIQAIALGEETSQLQQILSNLANLYFEENKDRVGIFMSLLEPVLMLGVGGIVGFIVVSMLLPIFSMNIG